MNAVLGIDRLPTGIRPLTSVITTVAYGDAEKALIHYAGCGLPDEVSLAALPQFITEQGNTGNRRNVRVAEVQLPVELLRRGVYFVDTLGLESPIVENTRTTERFLPQADAFVLVTSYEGPLSEEEVRFLRKTSTAGHPIFVVANKQDMATPREREDALQYVRQQLGGLPNGQSLRVFSVSARDGLAAKQQGDERLLVASGIAAFEAELVRFLINEKSDEFLSRMSQRIAAVLIKLPRSSENVEADARVAADARRIGINRSLPFALAPSKASSGTQLRPCEVCEHVSERCSDFLRSFQHQITVSTDLQKQLAESGGLCSFHTWLYQRFASPHGICFGFADVLDRWAARLLAMEIPDSASATALTDSKPMRIPAVTACMVCEAQATAESAAVASIVGRVRQHPDGAIGSLSQLCLPHARLLVAAVGDVRLRIKLIAREAAILRRTAEDMRRYALRHDGVRRYLASEEEKGAAQKALSMIAGHRTLNTQPP